MTRVYNSEKKGNYFLFECFLYSSSTTDLDAYMRYTVVRGVPSLMVTNYRLLGCLFRRELANFVNRMYMVEQSAKPKVQTGYLNENDSDLPF